MRSTKQMSITLPNAMAAKVRARVASGRYASESEVVRDGLRALEEHEAAVERWLREEVAPAYDAARANPGQLLSSHEVRRRLLAKHRRTTKGR